MVGAVCGCVTWAEQRGLSMGVLVHFEVGGFEGRGTILGDNKGERNVQYGLSKHLLSPRVA